MLCVCLFFPLRRAYIYIYIYTSRAYTGQQTSLLSMVLKLGVARMHNVFGYFLQFVDVVGDVLFAEYR